MPALNFKPEWVPLIRDGRKHSTVRKSARCKPGDRLVFYTGMRTKQCQKIGEGTCASVFPVWLELPLPSGRPEFRVGDVLHTEFGSDKLARCDGFRNAWHMLGWFQAMYGLPFTGAFIRWENFNDV